jgi:hypothetical protein
MIDGFRGIHTVESDPEFCLLWSSDLDGIAVRDFGDSAGDGSDGFTSERERCKEKGDQSCKQAKDEKGFYGG